MPFSYILERDFHQTISSWLTAENGCSTAPSPTAAGGRNREGEEVPKQGAGGTGGKLGDHVSNGERRWFKSLQKQLLYQKTSF